MFWVLKRPRNKISKSGHRESRKKTHLRRLSESTAIKQHFQRPGAFSRLCIKMHYGHGFAPLKISIIDLRPTYSVELHPEQQQQPGDATLLTWLPPASDNDDTRRSSRRQMNAQKSVQPPRADSASPDFRSDSFRTFCPSLSLARDHTAN